MPCLFLRSPRLSQSAFCQSSHHLTPLLPVPSFVLLPQARFGGSGGSSVLVTVMVCLWKLPEEAADDDGGKGQEEGGRRGKGGSCTGLHGHHGVAPAGAGCDGGAVEPVGHWSDNWTRLFSSR